MVTDKTFRKSNLTNLLLKVVLPVTSKYWSHHAVLPDFCHLKEMYVFIDNIEVKY